MLWVHLNDAEEQEQFKPHTIQAIQATHAVELTGSRSTHRRLTTGDHHSGRFTFQYPLFASFTSF